MHLKEGRTIRPLTKEYEVSNRTNKLGQKIPRRMTEGKQQKKHAADGDKMHTATLEEELETSTRERRIENRERCTKKQRTSLQRFLRVGTP